IKSFDALSCQFTDVILDRFCLEILPKINDKIERLNVESSFMECILCLTNYSNLRTLGLYDVQPEPVNYLFSATLFPCKKRPETNYIWMDKSIR
ncbi:unnamed protein product, partial [Rotaria sordida]